MANVPYGYHLKDGKLEVDAEIVKYIYEANLHYLEKPPLWGGAVIDGHAIYKDDVAICSVSDFVKGYIAEEINCMQKIFAEKRKEQPELTMSDLIENMETKAIVRQQIVKRNIGDFCHMVLADALGLVPGKMKGYVGKLKGLGMQV